MAPKATLYQHDGSLPKLPVPELKDTLALYVKSVHPLATEAEFEQTKKAVAEFARPGGPGETLQKRLQEHDNYMAYRDPVVVYVNYFFTFVDDRRFLNRPAARAATIITGAMAFRKLVVTEQLEPETAKGGPLSSHQYHYLFNSTRIPKIPECVTRTSDPNTNNHIVVIRKGKFYAVDLVVKGRQLSTGEIEQQIQRIYQMAGEEPEEYPVGLLTTEHRDTWTKQRETLLAASPVNQASLDRIETAAFAVCLDDSKPVTVDQLSRACWHGDGENRFFDKSLQFIIFDNGKAGFNGEHSMMDATPTSRLCDWIME
ncbi:Carnitine O-acetyltransferase mitochondrial, partial [Irineochytrium annulatum]